MIERTNGRRRQEHTAAELEGRRLAAALERDDDWHDEGEPAQLEPAPERLWAEVMREALGFALFVLLVLGGIIALELLTGTGGLTTGGR